MIYFSSTCSLQLMPPKITTTLLQSLRGLLRDPKTYPQSLHAYIVPSADCHQVHIAYVTAHLSYSAALCLQRVDISIIWFPCEPGLR